MNALLPKDTRQLLDHHPSLPEGRSLYLDRMTDPSAEKNDRLAWFKRMMTKSVYPGAAQTNEEWLTTIDADVLYAHLKSRLIVDMAVGVMENAGLLMNRFGLPFIPGTAIKGCARRFAIQGLMEQEFIELKVDRLVSIALCFGWSASDWEPGRRWRDGQQAEPNSDFWWAMAEDEGDGSGDEKRNEIWHKVSGEVMTRLLHNLQALEGDSRSKSLPAFAGLVSFLPAQAVDTSGMDFSELPIKPPPLGQLEPDVLTCHHSKYYSKQPEMAVALDTELPIPVVFPTVAPGHVFAFPLVRVRSCSDDLLQTAREWLSQGLQTFGIGAKTNAGYGWFEASESLQQLVRRALRSRARQTEADRLRKADELRKKQVEMNRIADKKARKEKLNTMTDEEKQDFTLDEMKPDARQDWIAKFNQRTSPEKEAIYRLLRSREPELWLELYTKGTTGKQKERKRFAPAVQAIFKMAKDRKEKMPT